MAVAVEHALVGEQWLWGAPTIDQVRIGWDEARRAVGGYAKFTYQRRMAEFPGGGRIIYRTLDDPDNARGHTADGLVVDEAADVKETAWYEVLRPMLIDTGGQAWLGGTPRGRNWFWREWMNAKDRDDSACWQAPTLGVQIVERDTQRTLERAPHPLENPNVQFAEIENLWRTMPEYVFRQEILAEFLESAGGVFRRVDEAAVAEPEEPVAGRQYIAGVDVAALLDFTVVSVMDAATKRMVYLDRFNRVEYETLEDRLAALHERYQLSSMIVEANSIGQPVIDHLVARGIPVIPFTTSNATKHEIITALQSAFEHGEITILRDEVLIAELQAFEMERLKSGMVRYAAPEGMHDDCVMSLALAWQAVSDSGPLLLWG